MTAPEDHRPQADAPAPAAAAELLQALQVSGTFGPEPLQRRETHASWVFLAGARAFKVKKPVKLEFLDYSTLALRHAACREEVRVNRELAPMIYLGVRSIVRTPAGLALAEEQDPRAIEYVVQMRRFQESRTLQGLIDAGEPTDEVLGEVASALAAFHERTPVVTAAEPAELLARWQRNLDELEAIVDPASWGLHLVREFAHAFVARHAAALNRRLREGHVRDGHGDLRCEHVLLEDGVQIVDRIEFDPRLRRLDVGADLAFLAMDLEANGLARAARVLVERYRSAGGAPGEQELLCFHAAYWALVRAKVAVLAASAQARTARPAQDVTGLAHGDAARLAQAERLRELAERLRWRARGAVALIVCGPAASGKSTLARELAARSGLEAISSDEVRKGLAGIPAGERAAPEHYTAQFTRATYSALGGRARARLAHGEGAIVDATCRTAEQRAILLDAIAQPAAQVLFVRCRVTLQTALARARRRMGEHGRVSDATPQVVERQHAEFEPMHELPAERTLELDCEAPLARQADEVTLALDRRGARHGRSGPTT